MSNLKREYINSVVRAVGTAKAMKHDEDVNESIRALWNKIYFYFNSEYRIDIKEMAVDYNYTSVLGFAEQYNYLDDIGLIVHEITKKKYKKLVGKEEAKRVFAVIRN